MASWVNYWKIVRPSSPSQRSTIIAPDNLPDSYGLELDGLKWYNQVMRGIGSRKQRYKQFDMMDSDVDIARALDTISEEIATEDKRTKLPVKIEYQTEDSQEVNESVVTALRAAVRHWCNHQDLNNRIYRIARHVIKYGDCFFERESPLAPWKFIEQNDVTGIEIDAKGRKVAYHINRLSSAPASIGLQTIKKQQAEVIPIHQIIHFTLTDEMGIGAPFGDSILLPIMKTFKQLSMLEDSVVIYRVVRAPERRAFYIDVGNMPAQRVKQYLEQIKNDIRQKRIPNTSASGQDMVDGTYNPHSISEDYFFAQTAAGRGSRVETLPGGENLGENSELTYFQGKIFRGLRIPSSYMRGADAGGAQVADGKVGIAYIEELRFANFITRLQAKIERVLDKEFKMYLKTAGIKVDDDLFMLKLPEPQNFALYRQAGLDAELINTFNSADGIKYLSKRFILKRYLGFTEDDLQMNEIMLKQERNISDNTKVADIQQMYDPDFKSKEVSLSDEEEAGSAVQPEEFGFGSEIEEPMEPTPDMTGSTPVKVAGPSAPGEEGEEGELPEPPRPS